MEWLLDKRAKSVGTTAQRVVADMHRDLDLQRKKVTELEALTSHLSTLCTSSLENEIFRLELRRKELLLDLQNTDSAILDRQSKLESAKEDVRALLLNSTGTSQLAIGNSTPVIQGRGNVHGTPSSASVSAGGGRDRSRTSSSSTSSGYEAVIAGEGSHSRGNSNSDSNSYNHNYASANTRGHGHAYGQYVDNTSYSSSSRDVGAVTSSHGHGRGGSGNSGAAEGRGGIPSTSRTTLNNSTSRQPNPQTHNTEAELQSSGLEEQCMEETEMLSAVREAYHPVQVPFIVHFSEMEHMCIYTMSVGNNNNNKSSNGNSSNSSTSGMNDMPLTCVKIEPGQGGALLQMELSKYEYSINSAVLVPNHDRDFPHVSELVLPVFMALGSDSNGDGNGNAETSSSSSSSSSRSAGMGVGLLVGAVQLPVIPSVILDVWRTVNATTGTGTDTRTDTGTDTSIGWVTTTVNGISFAVVERIYVISEIRYGVSQLVQVDIYGRHPTKGYLVLEQITN